MEVDNKEFEARLDESKEKVEECQKSKTLESCMQCDVLLECEIRKNYVKAVYESMSKGQVGGFEF